MRRKDVVDGPGLAAVFGDEPAGFAGDPGKRQGQHGEAQVPGLLGDFIPEGIEEAEDEDEGHGQTGAAHDAEGPEHRGHGRNRVGGSLLDHFGRGGVDVVRVALQEKTEKAQKSWAQREQNLQAEAAQLQQKYEKGLITSRDAQAQQESIQKKVASYQSNAQKEAQTLDEENYVFTNRAQDLLHRAVQEINSGKKYKLILNASALIDADTTLNITPAVLAKVNELYAADKKAEKK